MIQQPRKLFEQPVNRTMDIFWSPNLLALTFWKEFLTWNKATGSFHIPQIVHLLWQTVMVSMMQNNCADIAARFTHNRRTDFRTWNHFFVFLLYQSGKLMNNIFVILEQDQHLDHWSPILRRKDKRQRKFRRRSLLKLWTRLPTRSRRRRRLRPRQCPNRIHHLYLQSRIHLNSMRRPRHRLHVHCRNLRRHLRKVLRI